MKLLKDALKSRRLNIQLTDHLLNHFPVKGIRLLTKDEGPNKPGHLCFELRFHKTSQRLLLYSEADSAQTVLPVVPHKDVKQKNLEASIFRINANADKSVPDTLAVIDTVEQAAGRLTLPGFLLHYGDPIFGELIGLRRGDVTIAFPAAWFDLVEEDEVGP